MPCLDKRNSLPTKSIKSSYKINPGIRTRNNDCMCVTTKQDYKYYGELDPIIKKLFELPDPIVLSNNEFLKCITVMQGEIAITNSKDHNPILATFGLGPCHAIIMYNPSNKIGLLTHIDALSKLTILNNIFKYCNTKNPNDINIYISGGNGNHDMTLMIYDKLKMLGLHEQIKGTHIHSKKKYTQISLNTMTGEISTGLCKGWKQCPINVPLKPKELKKIYGFDKFIEHDRKIWYDIPLKKNDKKIAKGKLTKVNDFPIESYDNVFNNYNATSDEQKKMLEYSKIFSSKVSEQLVTDGPIYFGIYGEAGIGKTHLSVSIAKSVYNNGKNVLFINANTIGDMYQEGQGQNMDDIFKKWIEGQDLIILDDINSNGIAAQFFEKAFEYVHFSSKALLVTSNINISSLFEEQYPLYFNYNCVLILDAIQKESRRVPWTQNILIFSTDQKALQMLANYTGNQGAGILIKVKENNRSLQKEYGNKYTELSPKEKIRYADEPYKIQDKQWATVYDRYLHGVEKFDVVIMKVFDNHEAKSLLTLVDKAHHYGIKVIVLIESIEKFTSLITNELYDFLRKDTIRLYDRIRLLFPGINFNKLI